MDDKQDRFIPADPGTIKLSTFCFFGATGKTNTGLKCYHEVIFPLRGYQARAR